MLWSPTASGPLAVKNQIVTIHDIAYIEHPEWFNHWYAKWYQFVIPRLALRVKKIITVSEFSKTRLIEMTKISPDKIVVIPNGIDERFKPCSTSEVDNTRKALGIPSLYYILSLCSLEPRKNIYRLLRAWQDVHKNLPEDIWLVLAGAKGHMLVFKNLSFNKLPPRVHFTGYVSDKFLPSLYSGAIAFVYVSLYEGFGLPPLEAMACGTPVLTSNVTSLPEVVNDAALMVNPYDTEAIGCGIVRLVENVDLRKELIGKALKRAKNFTWDITAELTQKVLKEAMED
jgi:glycosyltransferase involved in cell wall biosynthesis